jgi:transcriptional regulator with XRE-family HTH domain
MVTKNAREVVIEAERAGLTQKKMAEICQVSPVTISRWKILGVARTSVISRLVRYLNEKPLNTDRKYLDEASLEDLAERARQLGFRITLTDINLPAEGIEPKQSTEGGGAMFFFGKKKIEDPPPFRNGYDRERVEKLCSALINGQRGATLGKEILSQLDQGYLEKATYERLSRWVNPERAERFAQPIASKLSKLLYGKEIDRG